uniref:uncharacterized protein LOC109967541 n=1 Tax=Monopterus albus TaxID=43700 RepID=UPI0009B38747|nr:uncharacterized protein LOC109967541 [Monopterus albus]
MSSPAGITLTFNLPVLLTFGVLLRVLLRLPWTWLSHHCSSSDTCSLLITSYIHQLLFHSVSSLVPHCHCGLLTTQLQVVPHLHSPSYSVDALFTDVCILGFIRTCTDPDNSGQVAPTKKHMSVVTCYMLNVKVNKQKDSKQGGWHRQVIVLLNSEETLKSTHKNHIKIHEQKPSTSGGTTKSKTNKRPHMKKYSKLIVLGSPIDIKSSFSRETWPRWQPELSEWKRAKQRAEVQAAGV